MKTHTVELTERELRAILGAIDFATENGPRWWSSTAYVLALYTRLRTLPGLRRDAAA